ncbi:hypothetical protein AB0E75_20895 [Streptomyces griseoviridis]|jgi:hypothetical protein|uniref:Uncharacterized protein n=3 Tax=Streptomyces TaxID=1883 RepID=A0ABT9LFP7_STRGD|nr:MULTISPECIES: hypothetical protein [Streptomyces]MDP9682541.1 hypothetical protein [Streptomyces griseoviridis]GGS28740.1 hypothetical protein GCM10010238_16800 [Streptomyces niveoruber]GGS80651.1 hypothetical protein GCM10010240_12430 [Streptomyces griseoviridis]GGU19762.1 hypothetical protein GCM10010259_07810 [Streptomyces daghestanicus]GHI32153.1 hypothetical protein Sdagh_38830 [Streptomyces daghestanicus]
MGPERPVSARTAVAVSVAALVTAAALFGVLVPEAAALPLPLPGTSAAAPANGELISVEGPLLNNLALPTLR